MYRLHKWLGLTAFVVSVTHWLWAQGPKWAVGWGPSERYGLNRKTIADWRKRSFLYDAPLGSKAPRWTALTLPKGCGNTASSRLGRYAEKLEHRRSVSSQEVGRHRSRPIRLSVSPSSPARILR